MIKLKTIRLPLTERRYLKALLRNEQIDLEIGLHIDPDSDKIVMAKQLKILESILGKLSEENHQEKQGIRTIYNTVNGKTYGPYYYTSELVNGVLKRTYLGKQVDKKGSEN